VSEVSKFATAVLYPVLPMVSMSLSDPNLIKFPVMNNTKYCVEEASTRWVTDLESKHDIPKWCLYKQGCGNE
jgi:hypothetical protein